MSRTPHNKPQIPKPPVHLTEDEKYKFLVVSLETEIEKLDVEIKALGTNIHDKAAQNSLAQIRVWRIRRTFLKKVREEFKMKLDLMRK